MFCRNWKTYGDALCAAALRKEEAEKLGLGLGTGTGFRIRIRSMLGRQSLALILAPVRNVIDRGKGRGRGRGRGSPSPSQECHRGLESSR